MEMIDAGAIYFALAVALMLVAHNAGLMLFSSRFGIAVTEVGFGFAPALRLRLGRLRWQCGFLFLGGYIKMAGALPKGMDETGDKDVWGDAIREDRLYRNKSKAQRLMVLLGSFCFQFPLAILAVALMGSDEGFMADLGTSIELLKAFFIGEETHAVAFIGDHFAQREGLSLFAMVTAITGILILVANWLPLSTNLGGSFVRQLFGATQKETSKVPFLAYIGVLVGIAVFGAIIYRLILMYGFSGFLIKILNFLVVGAGMVMLLYLVLRMMGGEPVKRPEAGGERSEVASEESSGIDLEKK